MTGNGSLELEPRGAAVVVARLRGELDMSNTTDLGAAIEAGVRPDARGVVIDLDGLEFMDSTAVSALFAVVRRLGERRQEVRIVVSSHAPARRIVELVQLDAVAPLHESEAEAVAALRAGRS